MSEEHEGGDESRRTAPAQASVHRSWWPGWIWGVPIAAILVSGWLLIRAAARGGTDITITFPDAHRIDPNSTTIEYRGVTVGHVTDLSLTKDGSAVKVSATMNDSVSRFLTTDTVFWLRGAKPSLGDLSSVGAVLSGPTIVMDPGGGKPTKQFQGATREPVAPPGSRAPVLFTVSFDGAVGDLAPGDPVKLRGFAVGEVKTIDFHVDANAGNIRTPVTLALYPSQFHIDNARERDSAAALEAVVDHLIRQGLRARLTRDPPFIGTERVALEMEEHAAPAKLVVSDGTPEIPAAPPEGLQSVLAQASRFPLGPIGQNILALTHHLDELASSPKLKDAIAQLNASLTEVHRTLRDVEPKIDEVVGALRGAAENVDRAAAAADQAVGGPASQAGLADTLREVRDAARSLRALAQYLEQHPESLISGKRK